MENSILSSPVMQYGFAGFCLILLAINVWLMNKFCLLLSDVTNVLSKNNDLISTINREGNEHKALLINIKDCLLSRPCIHEKGGIN